MNSESEVELPAALDAALRSGVFGNGRRSVMVLSPRKMPSVGHMASVRNLQSARNLQSVRKLPSAKQSVRKAPSVLAPSQRIAPSAAGLVPRSSTMPGAVASTSSKKHVVVVDGELEEKMKQKRAALAAVNAEDLDHLQEGARPAATRGDYGQHRKVAFDGDEADVFEHLHGHRSLAQAVANGCAAVFITLELDTSSVLAKALDYVTKAAIVLAVAAYLVSTEPTFQYQPTTCAVPTCNDDPFLCPGYTICEAVELPWVTAMSDFTTYYFTVEYGLKLLTVWAVSSRVAGVVPIAWEKECLKDPTIPLPVYSPCYQTYLFFWRVKNFIDFAAIFPCYIQYFTPSGASTNFVRVLRLLRLVRILRLLRLLTFLKNVDVAMELIWVTLRQSTLMLTVSTCFSLTVFVLFGCLMYVVEQGTFTVNATYPNGAYLMPSDDTTGWKVSNIPSAVQGIYWAIGVGTGNGNIAPTTDGGKALMATLSVLGVLGLAFPVGVLGTELSRVYIRIFRRLQKERQAADEDKLVEEVRVPLRSLRAMRFKIAAKKFLEGKFPAFPPATYLAALQAQIDADAANYDAEMKKWTMRRLRREYECAHQPPSTRSRQRQVGVVFNDKVHVLSPPTAVERAGGGGEVGGGTLMTGTVSAWLRRAWLRLRGRAVGPVSDHVPDKVRFVEMKAVDAAAEGVGVGVDASGGGSGRRETKEDGPRGDGDAGDPVAAAPLLRSALARTDPLPMPRPSCHDAAVVRGLTHACATVYVTLEVEESSRVAMYLDRCTKAIIVTSVVVFLMSTDTQFQYQPPTCDQPACNDDPSLCPGYTICEAVALPSVNAVSDFTAYYFTVEYGLKLLTVWSVSSRMAGVEPTDDEEETPAGHVFAPWYQTYRYFWRLKNLIDLAAIFPSYMQYFSSAGASTYFMRILRLLRLVRVLRLFRLLTFLKNVDVAFDLIVATLRQAQLLLSVFTFFAFIYVVVMGCLMYLTEQGTFTVNTQYPNGAYLKPTDDGTGTTVSNIFSAVQGLYWAILTGTGNGNINPTTDGGKVLQCVMGLSGVLSLTFPIGVVSGELDRAYTKHFKAMKAASDARRRAVMVEAAQIRAELAKANAQRLMASRIIRGMRNLIRARRFKEIAANYSSGDLPPFPRGTRLAMEQAEAAYDRAAAHAAATAYAAAEARRLFEASSHCAARSEKRQARDTFGGPSVSVQHSQKVSPEMYAIAMAVLGLSSTPSHDAVEVEVPARVDTAGAAEGHRRMSGWWAGSRKRTGERRDVPPPAEEVAGPTLASPLSPWGRQEALAAGAALPSANTPTTEIVLRPSPT